MAGILDALRGNSQMAMVASAPKPAPTQVAPTDVIGPTMAAYQAAMQKYMLDRQQQNATMGALAGIAGAGLGAWGLGGFGLPSWLGSSAGKQAGQYIAGGGI